MNAIDVLTRLAAAGVRPVGMSVDSRSILPNWLFAALPGAASDGRRYINDALANGAAAVVYETGDGFQEPVAGRPVIGVNGLRTLAGFLADEIFNRPSENLWVAGVTGTNGKTTVSQWLAQALEALGEHCGVIGTLGSGFPGALTAALNTTPDAPDLHRLLAGFVRDGGTAAAMEVSSIGLDQNRVDGVRFDVAIHTNLSRDHIDYHGTMEAYGEAKARLFDAPGLVSAVINLDDAFGLQQARRLVVQGLDVIGYSVEDLRVIVPGVMPLAACNIRAGEAGLAFDLLWHGCEETLDVRVAGTFNISNLLAVIGALLHRGVELDQAVEVAKSLTPPPGRMQLVGGHEGEPLVVVDYAHTPDALSKALEAVRESARLRGGELVCVFGCGGDRDHGKRPQMGELATLLADRVIVTSDNPRNEEPQNIISDILKGAGPTAHVISDRAVAIRSAVCGAGPADVILIAGKGHEPYQEIRGVRRPFSDLEQARQALDGRGQNRWNEA